MNSSTFGKTMENLRKKKKKRNARLVNNVRDYKKYVSEPSFVSQKIFCKWFFISDKPIYVGFSILDLSKFLMHEFHYKYIKRKYNAKVLFTDTD